MSHSLDWWTRWAVYLLAQTGVLAAIAGAAHWKIRSPRARRALWQSALLAVGLIWISEIAGVGEWLRPNSENRPVPKHFKMIAASSNEQTNPSAAPAQAPRPAPGQPSPRAVSWPLLLWFAGTGLFFIRGAVGGVWLERERRRMIQAHATIQSMAEDLRVPLRLGPIDVRIWPALRSPLAFGWRRRVVALPPDFQQRFSRAQQEAILAHEMAHLSTRDPQWAALINVICALAWWNPVIWWMAGQWQQASEAAADEASALTVAGPAALAESLLQLAREMPPFTLARGLGIAGNGFRSSLGRRVAALLSFSGQWRPLSAVWRWSPRLLALCLSIVMICIPTASRPPGSFFGFLVPTVRGQDVSPGLLGVKPALLGGNAALWLGTNPPLDLRPGDSRLVVRVASVQEDSKGREFLDKEFFASSPEANAVVSPAQVAKFLDDAKIGQGENIHVDLYRTEKENAVLSSNKFHAALEGLQRDNGTDLLSLPVSVLSPRAAKLQLAMNEVMDLVSSVRLVTNEDHISTVFATSTFTSGPSFQIDFTGTSTGGNGWTLHVNFEDADFLGYDRSDQIGWFTPTPRANPVRYEVPQPHLRVLQATGQGYVPSGSTLAVRGPAFWATNLVDKNVIGRPAETEATHLRYYLFLTPQN